MNIFKGLKSRAGISVAVSGVAIVSCISILSTPVSSSEKPKLKAQSRMTAIDWDSRTYSPDPPLDKFCEEPKLNVIILVDRSEDVVDSDRRNYAMLDEVSPGVPATYVNSFRNGLFNTWWITSWMWNHPADEFWGSAVNGTVNFYTYAYATNVVAQFDGTDTDGDGIIDKPAINTVDRDGDGVVVPKPVTELTDPDVKKMGGEVANIYFRGTGDPESASGSPKDIRRGYGTTTSPQGTGANNWSNAFSFATNMVSTRYETPDPNDDIDVVYIMAAGDPNQNVGFNQVPNVSGDNDLGIFSSTNFGHGGLNNTNAKVLLPPIETPSGVSTRDVRYRPSRESDIWHAANLVEALRTGDPVAELSSDSASGEALRPGLYRPRNPVQVDTFLGGRFPDPGQSTVDKIVGTDRYLYGPDFRKSFTGNREGGWLNDICGEETGYEFIPDISLNVSTPTPEITEGEDAIVKMKLKNGNPRFAIGGDMKVKVCIGTNPCTESIQAFNFAPDIREQEFVRTIDGTFGMEGPIRVSAEIVNDSISVSAPETGWVVKPNAGSPIRGEVSINVARVNLPS